MAKSRDNGLRQSKHLQVETLEHRRMLAGCSSVRDDFTLGLVECTENASTGYTLVAPLSTSRTHLVDEYGRSVNSWSGGPNGSRFAAYLGPDGSLVSSRTLQNQPINGAGATGELYMQDWDGNLTWQWTYSTNDYRLHHDFEVMPNGNILAIAWARTSRADTIALGRDPVEAPSSGLYGLRIIEIEPTGPTTADIVWEWNVTDHLVQDFDSSLPNFGVVADHPELVDINYGVGDSDWLHSNGLDYSPELDQIVVSVRDFDEFWIIDHSTTTAEAATSSGGNSGKGGDLLYRWGNPQTYDRGSNATRRLDGRHDAEWIDTGLPGEGNILVFNNGGFGASAQLVEVDLPDDGMGNYTVPSTTAFEPADPTWSIFTGINSPIMSGTQRLPNGNTVASYALDGEIDQYSPSGELVWRYRNPDAGSIRGQGSSVGGGPLFKSRTYQADYAGLAGRDLSADGYVERWTVGDYNLNGVINDSDLDQLCSEFGTGDLVFDVNFDDTLDAADIEYMLDRIGSLPGDANLDGVVDVGDFNIWNANKFTTESLYSRADFNCDGVVDVLDFNVWNANKFTSAAAPIALAMPQSSESSVAQSESVSVALQQERAVSGFTQTPTPWRRKSSTRTELRDRVFAQEPVVEEQGTDPFSAFESL